jgi:hypothetical protein
MPRLDTGALESFIKDRYPTQEDFCAQFGITRGGLRKWFVQEQVPDDQMVKLAEHFDVRSHVFNIDARDLDVELVKELLAKMERASNAADVAVDEDALWYWVGKLYRENPRKKGVESADIINFEDAIRLAPKVKR